MVILKFNKGQVKHRASAIAMGWKRGGGVKPKFRGYGLRIRMGFKCSKSDITEYYKCIGHLSVLTKLIM